MCAAHGLIRAPAEPGRMIALLGDAELDEGNIYEALLEGWKHNVRNLWWIIDYNRQSLDGVVNDALFHRIEGFFRTVDWRVVTLKFGKKLEAARHGPAGEALLDWIERCPNQLYSALTFKGGAAWRERLRADLAGVGGLKTLLDSHDDDSLSELMTNLGGHDLETLLDAFDAAAADDDAALLRRLHHQGLRPAAAGPQGQPRRPDESRPSSPNSSAAAACPQGLKWEPLVGARGRRRACRPSVEAAPLRGRQRLAPARGNPRRRPCCRPRARRCPPRRRSARSCSRSPASAPRSPRAS